MFGGVSQTHTETDARRETGTHEETRESHRRLDSYEWCNCEGHTGTDKTVGVDRTVSGFSWQAGNYLLTECNSFRDSHVTGINLLLLMFFETVVHLSSVTDTKHA